ncbi:hypothetical protein ACIBTP_03505 [Streptomyces avidinii]|uniref:hypothetical protein n=1 Tax=Streptomyces avidinii TaxID=1895 RepID=UPI00378B44D5
MPFLAKTAEMEDADRALAERLHALVGTGAPELSPKLWYGMPAYALTKPTPADEARIAELIRKAAS